MAELVYKTTWAGRAITKKNHQQIRQLKTKGGGRRPSIAQSDRYIQYEKDCLWQTRRPRQPFKGRLWVRCRYWMPTLQKPDLIGLMQSTSDILEKAGVIVNDKEIESYDGSRIMGKDAANPRAEIEIFIMGADEE